MWGMYYCIASPQLSNDSSYLISNAGAHLPLHPIIDRPILSNKPTNSSAEKGPLSLADYSNSYYSPIFQMQNCTDNIQLLSFKAYITKIFCGSDCIFFVQVRQAVWKYLSTSVKSTKIAITHSFLKLGPNANPKIFGHQSYCDY